MEPPVLPIAVPELFEQLEQHFTTVDGAVSAAEHIVSSNEAFTNVQSYCTSFARLLQEMRAAVLQAKIFQTFLDRHQYRVSSVANGFFCALPDELLLTIFSFLEPKDLWFVINDSRDLLITPTSSAKLLNKYFKQLCNDEELWKRMYDGRWEQSNEEMQASKRRRQSWHLAYVTRHFVDKVRAFAFVDNCSLKKNWRTNNKRLATTFTGHAGTVYCLQFDDEKLVTGSTDASIKIWDLKGTVKHTLPGHTARIRCLRYNDTLLASGSVDHTIKLWNLSDLSLQRTLQGHTKYVYCVQFVDNVLVSGSGDRTVKMWDIERGEQLSTLLTGGVGVKYVDNMVVSGSFDHTIKIWDARTGEAVRSFAGHTNDIWCLEVQGNYIASGSKDTTIRLWDLRGGSALRSYEGHTYSILSLQMDGTKIVSGSRDESIRIWDLNSNKCLSTLPDQGIVWCLAFDDTRLFAGSNLQSVRMWDYGFDCAGRAINFVH